jgi:LmbE family N-acetylglucosaminyl deacetylase
LYASIWYNVIMSCRPSDLYPFSATDPSSADALVIAPHPDDESIGCGGTIARHVQAGSRIKVIFLTDGEMGDEKQRFGRDYPRMRKTAAVNALAALGVVTHEFWSFPDGRLRESVPKIAERMLLSLQEFPAQLAYVPSPFEAHPDHRAAFQALWGIRETIDVALVAYEVLTPLLPNTLVDITSTIAQKRNAIRCYHTELSYHDYLNTAEGLNRFRSITIGGESAYAEAFITTDKRNSVRGFSHELMTCALSYLCAHRCDPTDKEGRKL